MSARRKAFSVAPQDGIIRVACTICKLLDFLSGPRVDSAKDCIGPGRDLICIMYATKTLLIMGPVVITTVGVIRTTDLSGL